MANSDALRARATFLYDLAERVDDWGERIKLRCRARKLEDRAKQIECGGILGVPILDNQQPGNNTRS